MKQLGNFILVCLGCWLVILQLPYMVGNYFHGRFPKACHGTSTGCGTIGVWVSGCAQTALGIIILFLVIVVVTFLWKIAGYMTHKKDKEIEDIEETLHQL